VQPKEPVVKVLSVIDRHDLLVKSWAAFSLKSQAHRIQSEAASARVIEVLLQKQFVRPLGCKCGRFIVIERSASLILARFLVSSVGLARARQRVYHPSLRVRRRSEKAAYCLRCANSYAERIPPAVYSVPVCARPE
jgi:hypothetical protein